MDTERAILTLRDVMLRRRRGLPPPDGIDVDELLEAAADKIEQLQFEVDDLKNNHHCDDCSCD